MFISQKEAYKSRENFEKYIPQRIDEITKNGKILDPKIVNEYPNPLERANADNLFSGNISAESQKDSIKFILNGGVLYQFLFAGAATRAAEILKGGAKYSFNIEMFNKNVMSLIDRKKSELIKERDDKELLKIKREIQVLEKSAKEFQNKKMVSLCLGAREICQYRVMLEKFSLKLGIDINKVLDNIYFIVHISELSRDYILNDFYKHKFFGFKRENIIFIVQDTFYGYVYDNGKLKEVRKFKRPFGHGYTLMQTVMPGSGFLFLGEGEIKKIDESPLEYVMNKSGGRAKLMANVNIDDLTKLTPLITDEERINYAVKELLEKDYDVVVEGVWNKKGQKGGSWVRDIKKNKNLLVEGLCLKTDKFKGLFEYENGEKKKLEEMPLLNKMSNFYKISSLLTYLPENGLPNYLDIREEILFLESITGDVTHINEIKSKAFVKINNETNEPEEIKTFKDVSDVYLTLHFMAEQEKDEDFVKIVSRIL